MLYGKLLLFQFEFQHMKINMQSGTIMKDSCWSWIVLVGVFVAIMLEIGIVKCLGVLLPELREQFSTDTWVIGLTISLVPGFGAVTCRSSLRQYWVIILAWCFDRSVFLSVYLSFFLSFFLSFLCSFSLFT